MSEFPLTHFCAEVDGHDAGESFETNWDQGKIVRGRRPTDDNDYVNKKTQLILKRMSTR